jgi:flavin reductase (DIM6/NTAB) family NADH-FMN oxidoreductase RutF
MPVATHDFTRAMARVPGPVAVATTMGPTGRPQGFTATSFSSLSLDPPLILICLKKSASTHEAFTGADHFLVNILSETQADVARRFAASGVDRFEAGDMTPCELGLPGLPGAAARVACTMHAVLDGGDHSILVGRVEESHVGEPSPLVYVDRSFTSSATSV